MPRSALSRSSSLLTISKTSAIFICLKVVPSKLKGLFRTMRATRKWFYATPANSAKAPSSLSPGGPTDYDVEREGHYSSGKYSHPKTRKTRGKRGSSTPIEDPEEPQ